MAKGKAPRLAMVLVIFAAVLRAHPMGNFSVNHYARIEPGAQGVEILYVLDLAEIPAKFGVNNVYGEIGTSFATCAVSSPPLAAALVGTLVRGLGADHVAWGSDSVWYGSPQWQIEAFRRLEIPTDMQKNNKFAPLGAADGLVKTAILGGNSARLYRVDVKSAQSAITTDKIASIKAEYVATGGQRTNTRYGYVAPTRV